MADKKPVRERACYTQMMGAWAIDPGFLDTAMATVRAVGVDAIIAKADAQPRPKHNVATYAVAKALGSTCDDGEMQEDPGYATTPNGTAVLAVHGPLSKAESSTMAMFGGTSTANLREAIAASLADPSVKRILLHVYSPGGTVSGVGDLADDIRAARSKKPVMAYIEDLGASAAYWLAAQATTIFASPHAEIGSIGVYSAVYDESEAFAAAGVKPIVFRSTKLKGGMVAGEKPSKEFIASYQKSVDATNAAFVKAIADGRGINVKAAEAWATAELWFAPEAAKMGLIDGVGTLQEAVARFAAGDLPRAPASSPSPYQGGADSTNAGAPTMATEAELLKQVAALQADLEKEATARKAAETKASAAEKMQGDLQLQFTALKERADQDHATVATLKADALTAEANAAALKLASEGRIPTEAVARFADRYKAMGKAEFEKLAADLPVKTIGVGGGKEPQPVLASDATPADRKAVLAEIDPKRFGKPSKGA